MSPSTAPMNASESTPGNSDSRVQGLSETEGRLTRRRFLRGMALAALGLAAACGQQETPTPAPTPSPTATYPPVPPTEIPTPSATPTPPATSTATPTWVAPPLKPEEKLIGYLRKRRSEEIQDSPWGIQYIVGLFPHYTLLDRISESGAKWARLVTDWPSVEMPKGRYTWGLFEALVDELQKRGLRVFLSTGHRSHPLYQDFPRGEYWPPTHAPEALDAYCRYCAALAKRFRDRVRHYEVWNEPNNVAFWRPQPDPQAYALLVRRVSAAIKEVDPQLSAVGGALAGAGPEALAFARAFLSDPEAAQALDVLTYHPYASVPEDTFDGTLALKAAAQEAKPGMQIWQGECGRDSSGTGIGFVGEGPWGYNIQAKWLLRRLLTDYLAGAAVNIYYSISEFEGAQRDGDPSSPSGLSTKGLLEYATWQPKPAFYALQNLAATVDSSWRVAEGRVEMEVTDPGGLFAFGAGVALAPWKLALERDGAALLAYWLPSRPQEEVQSATVRVRWPGVSWQEPVRVDLLTGRVFEVRAAGDALEVPLADYPCLLTERGALDLAGEPQQPSYEEIVSKLRKS